MPVAVMGWCALPPRGGPRPGGDLQAAHWHRGQWGDAASAGWRVGSAGVGWVGSRGALGGACHSRCCVLLLPAATADRSLPLPIAAADCLSPNTPPLPLASCSAAAPLRQPRAGGRAGQRRHQVRAQRAAGLRRLRPARRPPSQCWWGRSRWGRMAAGRVLAPLARCWAGWAGWYPAGALRRLPPARSLHWLDAPPALPSLPALLPPQRRTCRPTPTSLRRTSACCRRRTCWRTPLRWPAAPTASPPC